MPNANTPDLSKLGEGAPDWSTEPPWTIRLINSYAIGAPATPGGRMLSIGLPNGEQLQLPMRSELAERLADELTKS